jgi:topoisomerase-4 subunit A
MASVNIVEKIEVSAFKDELSKRYVAYALSTIMSRSLPDVRDGLKPVHRRLLYAMYQLNLNPASAYKKCARVVGDVIGKYHPHGDTAIYETLVRLAQDFTVRYPLIDGQGNFGSIDGDNAAAMRYTESKLTNIAMLMLENIEHATVQFKPTYDFQEDEPTVLPAAFPNLLANGSEGIAVGMATSIPPHNLDELCRAVQLLIDDPDTSIDALLRIIKGPDFPTGGVIVDSYNDILNNYITGRGSFRIRSAWHKDTLNSGLYQIIVTELPYQVVKSKLLEKIDLLLDAKKLPLVNAIRDESGEDIRIVIEPKSRSVDENLLMESLFKQTDLEARFNMNLNVVNKDLIPGQMNLKEVLIAFIEHREEVILNLSNFRLEKINNRLEILAGLLIAYINLDRVIEIIRYDDEPKDSLIATFHLTDSQADSILNMRLKSLRKLEEIEIQRESDALQKEKLQVEKLTTSLPKRLRCIYSEMEDIIKKYGYDTLLGARRTTFEQVKSSTVVGIDAFITKEPITIVISAHGWIKQLKGHISDTGVIKYKEGDCEQYVISTFTTNNLVACTKFGKFYTISVAQLSKTKGGDGEHIKMLIDIEQGDEILSVFEYHEDDKFLLVSNKGKGFVVGAVSILAQTRSGKIVMNLVDGAETKFCIRLKGTDDSIAIIGTNRKFMILSLNELPEMKRGQGVLLQKYKNAEVSDLKTFNLSEGLSFQYEKATKVITNLKLWIAKRGSLGKIPPVGFPRTNKF